MTQAVIERALIGRRMHSILRKKFFENKALPALDPENNIADG